MDMEKIIWVLIIGLVLIGIPVFLGKRTGQSPMELLFGNQSKNTLFGKRKKDEPDSGKKEKDNNASARQKNSSRQELMKTISALLSYGRRNRFYCIIPGTLIHGDEVASLAVLIVTRNSVLGFNCFGYGGTVHVGSGEEPWKQVINGEEKKLESPVVKNKKQKEIVDAVLKECGYPEIKSEIFGVFTASDVVLKDNRNSRCYTQKTMMEVLKGNRFIVDKGVDPRKVGKVLETHVKRKAAS